MTTDAGSYPCRCGVTHDGPYALHDYMHHNCFHDEPLILASAFGGCIEQLLCGQCGESFRFVREAITPYSSSNLEAS